VQLKFDTMRGFWQLFMCRHHFGRTCCENAAPDLTRCHPLAGAAHAAQRRKRSENLQMLLLLNHVCEK
jgi:hypothetical protein